MFKKIMSIAALMAIFSPFAEAFADNVAVASWYGERYRGRPTASGERFDPSDFTAAHPTLPFGTLVTVTNSADGRWVIVRINDRGPHDRRNGIDLSAAAARAIGVDRLGRAAVVLSEQPSIAQADLAPWWHSVEH